MFSEVKVLKLFLQNRELLGNVDVDNWIRWPAPLRDNVYVHLYTLCQRLVVKRLSERLHDLATEIDILEHTLEMLRELAPALRLQLANHALLCVDARALRV